MFIFLVIFDPLKVNDKSNNINEKIEKSYTVEELKYYDGKNGHKSYIAVRGSVYDITNHKEWINGEHHGIRAGKDVTKEFNNSHHKDSLLKNLKKIGVLIEKE